MIFLLEIDPDSNLRHEWEILRESIHEKEVVTPIDNTLSLFKYKSKGNKVFIYNISVNSFLVSIVARVLGFHVIYVSHEPWKYWSEILGSDKRNRLKYFGLNILNLIIFLFSNEIYVLSKEGLSRISRFSKRKTKVSRILLEKPTVELGKKTYDLCWIGACSEQKGFTQFIEIVKKYQLKAVICSNTSAKLPLDILRVEYDCRETANRILAQSKAVAIFHPYLTQSGVAPQALSQGCIIVSTNRAIFEEYKDTSNIVITVEMFIENIHAFDSDSYVACVDAFMLYHYKGLFGSYYRRI